MLIQHKVYIPTDELRGRIITDFWILKIFGIIEIPLKYKTTMK